MIDKIARISKTKQIIFRYGFDFQKRFGQNFLIDLHILDKIIDGAELTKEDIVIEVGPGIGSLTQYIAERAKKVIAIEIDKKLIPILNETLGFYNNVDIINEDILKINLEQLLADKKITQPIKVIANLPYYITTPIIMGLLESNIPLDSITVMVQKEVADRMKASSGSKDYGSLSLAIEYYCRPKVITNVSPNSFIPKPKVGSTVIKLEKRVNELINVVDEKFLFQIIRASFNQRRKTLLNGLYNQGNLGLSKEEIQECIIQSGLDEKVRGEALNLVQFAQLSNNIINAMNN